MKSNKLKKIMLPTLLLTVATAIGIGVTSTQKINVQAIDLDDDRYDDDRYDDDMYDDRVEYRGSISVLNITNHRGTLAAVIPIPQGVRVTDVDIDFEPHNGIEEAVLGNNIVIYGLRPGVIYKNLVLTIEGFNDVEYKYNILPFTTPANSQGNTTKPQFPVEKPQFPVEKPQFPVEKPQFPVEKPQFPGNQNNIDRPVTLPAIPKYLTDVYSNIFNRKVDKAGLDYWTARLSNRDIDLENFFKNLLVEPEFNKIAPTVEDKIMKIYEGVFQRKPDAGGFRFWVEKYKQELREEGNEREALEEIIDQMTDGDEFRNINYKLGLL